MRVIVVEENGRWKLRTGIGNRIGARMHTTAPGAGSSYPDLTDDFGTQSEAVVAAMRWNDYLKYALKNRAKSKQRTSE